MTPCATIASLLHEDPSQVYQLPEQLADHAGGCPICRAEIRAAQRLNSMLKDTEAAYNPGAEPRVLVERAVSAQAQRTRKRIPAAAIWAPIALAAAAAGVFVGTQLASPSGDPPGETAAEASSPGADATSPAGRGIAGREPTTGGGLAATACRVIVVGGESRTCDLAGPWTTRPGERAEVSLSDGSTLKVNHSSTVRLEAESPRGLRVVSGEALLDVAKRPDLPSLAVSLPTGEVEVTGTRLELMASQTLSVVGVLEGSVAASAAGSTREVGAGGEAVLVPGWAPVVKAAADLAAATSWADDDGALDGPTGLGTLRARKPGAKRDSDKALRLIDHQVRVRIQGTVARTEVEEAFQNDDKDTLEGLYTFPLPAGAQIASLDLLVDDTWEHGAIVERERGQKIWRGVIRNATPKKKKPKTVEEWIWVPGPWKDPALLEWKQGNQFQLRIFPIPGNGVRRVRIAWTETLDAAPGGRRYVLPLAADPSGQARAERFRFEAIVGGLPERAEVRATPYELEQRRAEGTLVLSTELRDFAPISDIVLHIPDPAPTEDLRTWTYRDPSRGESFALLTVDPPLPLSASGSSVDVVMVVDRSYSTQAARLARAGELVRRVTAGLGEGSRVAVLACGTRCERVGGGFRSASETLGEELGRDIAELESLGSSRLEEAIAAAGDLLREASVDRSRARVIYVGDGIPTVGEIDPGQLSQLVSERLGGARLLTVSLGGEVDDVVLRSMARAGGGAYVAQRPGHGMRAVVYRVVDRLLSEPLRAAELMLPPGLRAVAPATLGVVWPGEELLIAARLEGRQAGEVTLKGTLGGEAWEQTWKVELEPTEVAGNAFLPRLWAERRIDDLQQRAAESHREEIVELSKRYHVLSRHTSLLVLESEAMARAFGVEDTRPDVEWTGEEEAEVEVAEIERPAAVPPPADLAMKTMAPKSARAIAGSAGIGAKDDPLMKSSTAGSSGGLESELMGKRPRGRVRLNAVTVSASDNQTRGQANQVLRRRLNSLRTCYERVLARRPSTEGKVALRVEVGGDGRVRSASSTANGTGDQELVSCLVGRVKTLRFAPPEGGAYHIQFQLVFTFEMSPPRPRPGGSWVKVVRKAYRVGTLARHRGRTDQDQTELARRKAALAAEPESRDRTEGLLRWYVRLGDLDAAQKLASAWLEKDRMDPGALLALSDIAALRGQLERGAELLASAMDVDPTNVAGHERMQALYERARDETLACAHARTLALMTPGDWERQVEAIRCGGERERLLSGLDSRSRKKAAKALDKEPKPARVWGSLVVKASWDGPDELDVLVVTPKGRVLSRLGGETKLVAEDAVGGGGEKLGTPLWELGRYQLVVVHADPDGGRGRPVSGKLQLKAYKDSRTLSFETDGRGAAVADLRVEIKRR